MITYLVYKSRRFTPLYRYMYLSNKIQKKNVEPPSQGAWKFAFMITCLMYESRRFTPFYTRTGAKDRKHSGFPSQRASFAETHTHIGVYVTESDPMAKANRFCCTVSIVGFRFITEWGSHSWPWASCQIREIAGAHAPGMSGTFSPPPRVRDPDMHHGTSRQCRDACRDR